MTVTKNVPPPKDTTYTIHVTLSEEAAAYLVCHLGKMNSEPKGLFELYGDLRNAVPDSVHNDMKAKYDKTTKRR